MGEPERVDEDERRSNVLLLGLDQLERLRQVKNVPHRAFATCSTARHTSRYSPSVSCYIFQATERAPTTSFGRHSMGLLPVQLSGPREERSSAAHAHDCATSWQKWPE